MLKKLKYFVFFGLVATAVQAHDLNPYDNFLRCDKEIAVKIYVASTVATVRILEGREPRKADVIHMLLHTAAIEGWHHGELADHLLFVEWALEFKDGDKIKSACD